MRLLTATRLLGPSERTQDRVRPMLMETISLEPVEQEVPLPPWWKRSQSRTMAQHSEQLLRGQVNKYFKNFKDQSSETIGWDAYGDCHSKLPHGN